MSEHKDPKPAPAGHETTDINIRKVAVYGLALLVMICLAGLLTTFVVFKKAEREDQTPPSPLYKAQQPPPEPRLQATPMQDLKKFRAAEEARLNSYGWVDKPNGVVRIPVDRAMDLVVARGLPPRPDARIEAPVAPETGKTGGTPKAAAKPAAEGKKP